MIRRGKAQEISPEVMSVGVYEADPVAPDTHRGQRFGLGSRLLFSVGLAVTAPVAVEVVGVVLQDHEIITTVPGEGVAFADGPPMPVGCNGHYTVFDNGQEGIVAGRCGVPANTGGGGGGTPTPPPAPKDNGGGSGGNNTGGNNSGGNTVPVKTWLQKLQEACAGQVGDLNFSAQLRDAGGSGRLADLVATCSPEQLAAFFGDASLDTGDGRIRPLSALELRMLPGNPDDITPNDTQTLLVVNWANGIWILQNPKPVEATTTTVATTVAPPTTTTPTTILPATTVVATTATPTTTSTLVLSAPGVSASSTTTAVATVGNNSKNIGSGESGRDLGDLELLLVGLGVAGVAAFFARRHYVNNPRIRPSH